MKFIRNGRIRERIVDAVAKGILIAFSALVCLWMISGAKAAGQGDITEIRQSAQEDGSHLIEFVLSKNVTKEDVAVDFQRNFIQLSLKGISAFPARTQPLNHASMDKVFTYQYQPDMARARLLLKGQASEVQGKSRWEVNGKSVKIWVRGEASAAVAAISPKDSIKTRAAAPKKQEKAAAAAVDAEELKAREEIMQEVLAPEAAEAERAIDSESLPLFAQSAEKSSQQAKGPEANMAKIFASLLLIVGVIGAGSLAFKRFVLGGGVGFQRQGKMIEVISSQSLGPKRSIAVVKVLDQHMVVGMSGDGMTLLANLGADVNIDRFIDEAGPGPSFTDTLQKTLSGSAGSKGGDGASSSIVHRKGMDLGFRASLKKRLEGFKPL